MRSLVKCLSARRKYWSPSRKRARVEDSRVDHRQRAREVVGGRRAARPRKDVGRRFGDAAHARAARHVGVQDLGAERVRIVLLRPLRELLIREEDRLIAGRGRRSERLDREEEEQLFLRDDRPANRRREVVGVERIVIGVRAHEHGLREHALVVVVVAHDAVELIRSRLGRAGHLDGAAAAVFRREGVHLDARLLNRVGIRRQVQDTLPDAARHVEAVHDELVGDRSLTVGADVDGRFRRVVVDAGSRCPGASRLSASHGAETRHSGPERHERDVVTTRKRQRVERLASERQLIACLGRVDERRHAADRHLLRVTAPTSSVIGTFSV